MFEYMLVGLVVFCGILHYYTRTVASAVMDHGFKKFQQIYLSVYLLAMSNIWNVLLNCVSSDN